MADYPFTTCSQSSSIRPESGIKTDFADDGSVRSRRHFTQTRYTLTLVHDYMAGADRAALLAHYGAHAGTKFNVVSPWGDTYLVQYLDEPEARPAPGGYWHLTSQVVGVRL